MLDAILAKLARGPAKGNGFDHLLKVLFQEADPQVLERLGPVALDEVAGGAFDFIGMKSAGTHQIRYRQIGGKAIVSTLIEILNDDMPFLVDSVMGEVLVRDVTVQLVLHPILKVERGQDGRLTSVNGLGEKQQPQVQESFIQVYLDPIDDRTAADLVAELDRILVQVRLAVADWRAMLSRLRELIETYRSAPLPVSEPERQESIAFLEWLEAGNFTFLGVREFRLTGDLASGRLDVLPEKGLGILRDPKVRVLRRSDTSEHLTPEVRRFYAQPSVLIVSKANALAKVHRRANLDYIGAKTFDADGQVSGEVRLAGLFTSAAYTRSVRAIPFLRRKADRVVAASGFPPDSHNGKSLLNIIETYPRDELFQIPVAQLEQWAVEILDLDLRPRVRVFPRIDEFDRFVTALVYVPRDRFSTEVRQRIAQLLAEAYGGRLSSFTPYFLEGPLVRLQIVIARDEGPAPKPDRADLEEGVRSIVQSWQDRLAQVIRGNSSANATSIVAKYGGAFSAGYRETFGPERALQDIARIEALTDAAPVAIDFYADDSGLPGRLRVSLYRLGEPIPLSDRVPVLENLGFRVIDERSYRMKPMFDGATRDVRLHDMVLETRDGKPIVLGEDDKRLEAAFLAVWDGRADNDGYNRLILAAGLDWERAEVLRAYGAYMRQIRSPFGPAYIAQTLTSHSAVAKLLMELFACRFDPALKFTAEARTAELAKIKIGIEEQLAIDPEPRRGSHPTSRPQSLPVDATDEFLRARRGGPASPGARLEDPQHRSRWAARAETLCRDLGLCAPRRGCAFALRANCSRRIALVRPRTGFPHGGPRPRQGAAGQKHRHRAARRQGRVPAEASAGENRS